MRRLHSGVDVCLGF